MAIDSNSLTFSEYGMMSNDPLIRRVVFSLLDYGAVLSDIPLTTQQTLIANGARWTGNLPSVDWRKVNQDPVATKGKPENFQEQVYIIRNNIDVDRYLVEDRNRISDPRATQLSAYLRSVTYDLNDKFINNDHINGDEDSFVGLKYRIDNPNTYGVNSEMKIDGGGVDLSMAGMTANSVNTFLELIDQLLNAMGNPEGNGVILYMNELMKRRFATALRVAGGGAGWNTVQDAFDRTVDAYRNARIRVIGRKADQTTQIITSTEAADGSATGASTHTSIYAVRYGEEFLTGWQFNPLVPRDLGLLENGVIYRTVIDWAFGLYYENTRCLGRIHGIKVA